MVATDLIAGWWRTDRLFCIAVAFLALVFGATTVTGVIALLQRRPVSRYLLLAGALVAFLTYIGVFIAGARVAWVVHLLPLLPISTAVLVMLRKPNAGWTPDLRRTCSGGEDFADFSPRVHVRRAVFSPD